MGDEAEVEKVTRLEQLPVSKPSREQLLDFEKAIYWKLASVSKLRAAEAGWRMVASRMARGAKCCLAFSPKPVAVSGEWMLPGAKADVVLSRAFVHQLNVKPSRGYTPAHMLPVELLPEFGYVELVSSLREPARMAILEQLWKQGFSVELPAAETDSRGQLALSEDDWLEVRCESPDKWFLEWAAAGCAEPDLAPDSCYEPTYSLEEVERWQFAEALTWKANKLLKPSQGRYRLAAVWDMKSCVVPLESSLSFVLDSDAERLGRAAATVTMRVKRELWKSVRVHRVRAAAPAGLDFAWVNELPDGDDAWQVVKWLSESPAFKLDFGNWHMRLGAAKKRKLVEEWKQAGSPRVWL